MFFDVDGRRSHALTGGPAYNPSLPTVVFLHGAGMDATVWSLQTRWLAHHGYGVLAVDFPGHGRSGGPALTSIDAMADWVAAAIASVGGSEITIVGHSMGSLVAMALAARRLGLVERLVLIGTALEMKVGPALLNAAAANSQDAFAMVNLWGHGTRAGLGGCEAPGLWMAGSGHQLLRRSRPGVLSSDLEACNAFRGNSVAERVDAPVLILQGSRDQMTPTKGANELSNTLQQATLKSFDQAGHMLMVEEGSRVLSAIADFLPKLRTATPTLTQPVGAPP